MQASVVSVTRGSQRRANGGLRVPCCMSYLEVHLAVHRALRHVIRYVVARELRVVMREKCGLESGAAVWQIHLSP